MLTIIRDDGTIHRTTIDSFARTSQMWYAMVRREYHARACRIELSRNGDYGCGKIKVFGDWKELIRQRNAYWFPKKQRPAGVIRAEDI